MQSWFRVLRGVYPYRWSIVLSMICALGVGLSYASGLTVMYPVMTIFISPEHLDGWANHKSAEARLGVPIAELSATESNEEVGLSVPSRKELIESDKKDPEISELKKFPEHFAITGAQADGKEVNVRDGVDPNEQWNKLVSLIAHAKDNKVKLEITRTSRTSTQPDVQSIDVLLHDPSLLALGLNWATDRLPQGKPMVALYAMVTFFVVLCIVGSIFRYYQQYLGMTVANRVIMDLRRRAYDRIVQLPTSHFAQKGTSDVMSRLLSDTGILTEGVTMAFGKAVQEPIKAAGAFCAAFWLNWQLTLMIVVSMPFLALIIGNFSKRMRKASRRAMENSSSMLSIINETLIGARVVKAYSAEGYERRRFSLAAKKLLKQQIKLNHYNALSRPFVETLAVILGAIPMLIAARWVLSGEIQTEKLLTILVLFGAMLEPMRKLADVNAKVQQTNAAATRVFEIIDLPLEPNIGHSLPKVPRHKESLEFRDIVFSYPGHEDEVILKHVSFTVKAGQNVAVVGGNGSGKTTLLQLLPRLYIPTSGQILIDGVDTGTVTLRSLRKQIGLVTQDTLLFADTIYNNIAYGTRHATREQVLDASRQSFADEFIRELPEGYETKVGEHGVRLSGGQKQRIAIARAILHNPTILILDEAMSQIDSDSENKITEALRVFTKNRTVLMIAHRFQSVITADMIVCLERGEVAGIGTHAHLLETCPPYQRLYENQFHENLEENGQPPNGVGVVLPTTETTPEPAPEPTAAA